MRILKRLKNLYQSLNALSTLSDIAVESKIKANQLLVDALSLSSPLISKRINEETELIVSLTTYSKRIHDVHLVIESIAQQTLKPNRLILWLDESEFTLETIPLILHKQVERGLEIRFCPNYRSYKKLIPTLKKFPDANIITIDDDVLYPHDMVELLYKEHQAFPDCIIGHRAHQMKFDSNGRILPYINWEHGTTNIKVDKNLFFTGIGGVFYPPNSLNEEVLNSTVFMNICPNADDVWFKAMALMKNVKCKKVSDERSFFNRFLLLQDSQDIALYNENIVENDFQINAVFEKYNL